MGTALTQSRALALPVAERRRDSVHRVHGSAKAYLPVMNPTQAIAADKRLFDEAEGQTMRTGPCAPAAADRARTRTCGFAVPDPRGVETEMLLVAAWTEAVFGGEQRFAARVSSVLSWHMAMYGEDSQEDAWREQHDAHMRGLH